MSKRWILGAIALLITPLVACSPQSPTDTTANSPRPSPSPSPEATSPTPSPSASPESTPTIALQPQIQTFTTDELFKVKGGGCGMSLWRKGNEAKQGFIFFNGVEEKSMWMKINGKMTQFRRTAATGQDFYGQKATQSFLSLDGLTQVDVTVQTGEKGYESLSIPDGTLKLRQGISLDQVSVQGDAGC